MKAIITETARNLRKNATKAEKIFWKLVRNRKIKNKKFYRQYPIEFEYYGKIRHFIADFYCHECNLVVEIDGGIHETQKEYDALRTAIINKLGMRVIRYKNEDIMHSIEKVIRDLEKVL